MSKPSPAPRRRFLKTAATSTVAAGAMAAPMVSNAQTTALRFQSTWPSKDIFHEYANDFAKKVNDMAGSRLKIEVLPAGAVVPAFQLLEAVAKGTLDGGHGVLGYHYGKQNALALWGSGSGYVPSISMGFCVAITMKGALSTWVTPSTVTWRSSMDSSRADCVFGDARLISSPTTMFAKMPPGLNSKSPRCWLNTDTPVTSLGSRSGVNWMRLTLQSIDRPRALASIVLPTPGTSSRSR